MAGKITIKEFADSLKLHLIKDIEYIEETDELVITTHLTSSAEKRYKLNIHHLANVIDSANNNEAATPQAVYNYFQMMLTSSTINMDSTKKAMTPLGVKRYIEELAGTKLATLDANKKLSQSEIPNIDCGEF